MPPRGGEIEAAETVAEPAAGTSEKRDAQTGACPEVAPTDSDTEVRMAGGLLGAMLRAEAVVRRS